MEVIIVEDLEAKTRERRISTRDLESDGNSNVTATLYYEYPIYHVNDRMCMIESLRCVTNKTSDALDLSTSTSKIDYTKEGKNVVVSYDNFDEDSDLQAMMDFVRLFGIRVEENDENATHLVVKLNSFGHFHRTEKVGNALVVNRPIVTFQWIIDSMASKSLMPVHYYMPVDRTEEPSPLASWRFAQGIIYSRNEWTNQCTLLFHTSLKRNKIYPFIKSWAEILGFVIIDKFEHFEQNDCRLNIVLLEDSKLEERCSEKPPLHILYAWMYDYKALSVNVSWFLECVFQYKYVEITTSYLPMRIPRLFAESTGVISYYKINEEHKNFF